jgi:uncharacterized protein (DUF2267 family)
VATTETHIPVFESTLQTTHKWLRELELIASLRNESEAYSVLRAVLHSLRDRLLPDEAVNLAAELPMLIRGFYYEGWKPGSTPKKLRTLEDFLRDMPPLPSPDETFDAEKAVRSVFLMLDHRISEGEIEDIRQMLPEEVRSLWPEHEPAQ